MRFGENHGTIAHLGAVYVRQSTPQQVAENRESLARQYALSSPIRPRRNRKR